MPVCRFPSPCPALLSGLRCQIDTGNRLWLLTASSARFTLATSYDYPPNFLPRKHRQLTLATHRIFCQIHSGYRLRLLTASLPDSLKQSTTATHRIFSPHHYQMQSGYRLRLPTASLPDSLKLPATATHRISARFNQATGYGYSPHLLTAPLPDAIRLPAAATHRISARCTLAISLPNQPHAIPEIHRIPANRIPQSSSSFSTLRKAFWGISTLPIWRMRFLPSFCFSSSFFFRVMSPP